jgi:hypothetical protein
MQYIQLILIFNYGDEGEFKMTQEQIIALAQIYNSLMCIETKGENTILMGKCLLKL